MKYLIVLFEFNDTGQARDAFYACLEKESDKKPTEIASVGLLYPVECRQSRAEYVKQCRPTWVIDNNTLHSEFCFSYKYKHIVDSDSTSAIFLGDN